MEVPDVLVPKPNGGKRSVVGFRALNEVLVHDAAPVPRSIGTRAVEEGARL